MKKAHIILVLILTCFISCKNDKKGAAGQESNQKAELLLGRWETSTFINENQFKKTFKDDIEEGMSGEMTLIDEYHFIKGNRFNQEGEVTFTLKMEGQELPLKFYGKLSGTWSIHDNTLVTVAEDSKIIPMDDFTKNVIANAPEFGEMLQPTKGEAISMEIKTLTANVLQVVDEELAGLIITYNKK